VSGATKSRKRAKLQEEVGTVISSAEKVAKTKSKSGVRETEVDNTPCIYCEIV